LHETYEFVLESTCDADFGVLEVHVLDGAVEGLEVGFFSMISEVSEGLDD
jgi:hypothetical protein